VKQLVLLVLNQQDAKDRPEEKIGRTRAPNAVYSANTYVRRRSPQPIVLGSGGLAHPRRHALDIAGPKKGLERCLNARRLCVIDHSSPIRQFQIRETFTS
jgi:hypothetical protein